MRRSAPGVDGKESLTAFPIRTTRDFGGSAMRGKTPGTSRLLRYVRAVSLLVIGAVAGGLVTHYSRLGVLREKYRQEMIATERAEAEAVCRTLTRSMDTRMFAMRSLLHSYARNRPASYRQQKWMDYSKVLREWNNSLNDNAWRIARYFGTDRRETFLVNIQAVFRNAGSDLEDLGSGRTKPTKGHIEAIGNELDSVNRNYCQFLDALLADIVHNNVGMLRSEHRDVSHTNRKRR